MSAFYINGKGAKVTVVASQHAKERFKQRYERLHNQFLTLAEADEMIQRLFNLAKRDEAQSKRLMSRAKKHKSTSLYFVHNDFRFVVSGNTIVTVEIASKANRHCNHRKGGMHALIDAVNNGGRYQAAY